MIISSQITRKIFIGNYKEKIDIKVKTKINY